jgi:hypothetical protein
MALGYQAIQKKVEIHLRVLEDIFVSMFGHTGALVGDIFPINVDSISFPIFEPIAGPRLWQVTGSTCNNNNN